MFPEPEPDVWSNVRGDYVAARNAAAAMRGAASRLEMARAQRAALAATAVARWTGRYGEAFNARLASLRLESVDLQARLLAQARRLDIAADDAASDQRSRVADRKRITDERAKAAATPSTTVPGPSTSPRAF